MGWLKHLCVVTEYLFIFTIIQLICGGFRTFDNPAQRIDPFEKYGTLFTYIMYAMKSVSFLCVPFVFTNIIGILSLNTFQEKSTLKCSPNALDLCVCVRIVTRGDYPALVIDNARRTLNTCLKLGLENFVIDVVSDKSIGLPFDPTGKVRETVVPMSYKAAGGTLYKARALNYCLEEGVNSLTDEDYIIHLDEDSRLTESAIIGIINFIKDGKHSLGQGRITYASGKIFNYLTTLMDCVRVAVDFGMLRFTLGVLHRPVFGWKGSFVVSKVGVERDITFDHGPRGSIAEDCYFALMAYKKGYSFNWIEGKMKEKSTFTLTDFIRQRKRWIQGLLLVLTSKEIPIRCKMGIFINMSATCSLLIAGANAILPLLFPVPTWQWFDVLNGINGSGMLFFYIFGAQMSFNHRRLGTFKYVLMIIGAVLVIPVSFVCEGTAALLAMMTSKTGFYVVSKTAPGHYEVPHLLNV